MADLQSVIKIIFSGDDRVSQLTTDLAGKIGGLGSAAQTVAQPLADFAALLVKIETGAIAMGAALGVMAVRENIKFQDSLYLVQKQLGDTGVSIEQSRKDIEGLALQYGINANEVAASVAGFLAAGYDYKTAASLVKTSTELMIGGEVDAKTATEALIASISGFRVKAVDAAEGGQKIADILNKIADISGGSFEEIAVGFSRIAPVAKDAGLSMEEAAAILAKMIDTFRSGEIASNALKSGLASLIKPTDDAREAMKAANIVFADQGGALLPVKQILENMAASWGGLTDQQRQSVAVTVFGTEQYNKLSDLFGDWSKKTEYQNKLLDAQNGAVGSLAREVQGKLGLMSTAVNVTNESWRQFLENLGRQIATDPNSSIGTLIASVGQLGLAFKDIANSPALDPLIALIQQQAAGLAQLLGTIAANLPAAFENVEFSGLINAFGTLGDTLEDLFSAFFGDIDLTTVEGLRSALQTLVDAFTALTLTVSGIAGQFEPFLSAAREAIAEFQNLDSSSQLDFGKYLGAMTAIANAGLLVGGALIAIGQSGAEMGRVLDIVFSGIQIVINSVQVAFDTVALAIANTAIGIATAVRAVFDALGQGEQVAAIDAALASLNTYSAAVSENLNRNATELKDGYNKAVGDADAKTDGFNQRLATAQGELDKLKTGASGAKTEVEKAAVELGKIDDITLDEIKIDVAADGAGKAKTDIQGVTAATGELVPKLVTVRDENGKVIRTYTEMTNVIPGVTGSLSIIGSGMDDAAKKTRDAAKESNNFRIKMEEIASNERIKTIEAYVSLNVADLEAQTQQVEAAFDSINTTVNSTGDLLGSLFGNLAGADAYTKLEIIEQIEAENKRRDAALELQRKLTEAEIENVQAKTRALDRGDSLIQIDGTGLAPQLEAFMWEVLKAIRIRANAEFQDFLLGVAS